jgi:hypothetical protein
MLSTVLSVLVPALLAAVVISKCRRSIAYVLLIPIFFDFGRAAYLDTYGLSFARLSSHQIGVALLVACSLLLVLRRDVHPRLKTLPLAAPIIGLYAFWILAVGLLSAAEGLSLGKSAVTALFSTTLPVSFAAWFVAVSRISEDELLGILRIVAIISAGLGLLYSLQAAGVHVYPYAGYSTVTSAGRVFTRDFATLGFMGVLVALAWSMAERPHLGLRVCVAALALLAVAASFTRSFLIAGIVAIFVSGLVVAVRTRRSDKVGSRRTAGLAAIATIVGVFAAIMTDELWASRLLSIGRDASFTGRAGAILGNVRAGSWVDALVGYGFEGGVSVGAGVVLGDSLWIELVYRLGLVGALLLAGALVAAGIDALRCRGTRTGTQVSLSAVAAGMPLSVLVLSLAGIPSSLHIGLALAFGPALAAGVIAPGSQVCENAVLAAVLPSPLPGSRVSRTLFLVLLGLILAVVEIWIGIQVAR